LSALRAEGFQLELLPVNRDGVVDPEDLRLALANERVSLVSIMYANHETGVRQPTRSLASLCQAAGVPFHVDAVQGLRSEALTLSSTGADALTFSAHKLNGPKGIGALALSDRAPDLGAVDASLPAALVVGLAAALGRPKTPNQALRASRDALQRQLLDRLKGAVVNGATAERLASHLSLSIRGVSGEAVTLALDQAGVAISAGAACASGDPSPSSVMLALGHSRALATGTVRFSLQRPLDANELSRVANATETAVTRLLKLG
jgi:cysteine desulfurase